MAPFIIAAALSLLALDAAPAASTPVAAPAAAPAAHARSNEASDLDKVVCKSQPITGSRFVKRVCMTKGEWNEQERRTQEFERHINQTPNGQASGGLGGG